MSNLIVTFTGLGGFVPNTASNQASLLLFGGDLHHWRSVDSIHLPVVVFRMDQFQDSGIRRPDLRFQGKIHPHQDAAEVELGLYFLQNLDVAVAGADPNSLSIVDRSLVKECPTNADRSSFSWLAPIDHIMSGKGTVKGSCLGGSPPPSVAARVRLRQGELRVVHFASSPDRRKWKFGLPQGTPNILDRAIADVLDLEAPMGNAVEITLTPLRQPARPGAIRLKPVKTEDVDVSIRNLPLLDVLGVRKGTTVLDYHFDNLYRFSTEDPGQWQGYVPHRGDFCSGGIVVENPTCPPARFLPHPQA